MSWDSHGWVYIPWSSSHIYLLCFEMGFAVWSRLTTSLRVSFCHPSSGWDFTHEPCSALCLPRLFQQHVKSSQKQFTEAVRSRLTGSNSGQHKRIHWILSFSFQSVFCQDYWHGSRVTSTQTTKPNRYKPCNSLMYTQTCTWLLWEEPHLPSTTGCLSGCASEACK